MSKSPTQKSLAYLRSQGWQVAIVEHWNAHAGIRQDVWHFGDLLASKVGRTEDEGAIALVQVTSKSNMAARRKKIQASTEASEWKLANGFIILHGWDGAKLTEEWL